MSAKSAGFKLKISLTSSIPMPSPVSVIVIISLQSPYFTIALTFKVILPFSVWASDLFKTESIACFNFMESPYKYSGIFPSKDISNLTPSLSSSSKRYLISLNKFTALYLVSYILSFFVFIAETSSASFTK